MSHRASARFAHLLHCPMHWLHFIAALATFADDARTGKLPPPPRRLRASAVRTSKATSTQTLAATPESGDGGGPNLLVECEMRRVAFDMAMRHPSAQRHAAMIQTSLAMTACPALDFSPPPRCTQQHTVAVAAVAAVAPTTQLGRKAGVYFTSIASTVTTLTRARWKPRSRRQQQLRRRLEGPPQQRRQELRL